MTELARACIPVSTSLLDDVVSIDFAWLREHPRLGPSAPPAHGSHRRDSETGECLLCDATEADRLFEVCPYVVVRRTPRRA